jgi:hypothetical protein
MPNELFSRASSPCSAHTRTHHLDESSYVLVDIKEMSPYCAPPKRQQRDACSKKMQVYADSNCVIKRNDLIPPNKSNTDLRGSIATFNCERFTAGNFGATQVGCCEI